MTINTIITILVIIAALIGISIFLYIYLKNNTLDKIRADVYQLFLKAEHIYKESGQGKQKMKWVISRARCLLPSWAQLFITEEFLYKVFETWFQAVKDLLDDGKYNKSVN